MIDFLIQHWWLAILIQEILRLSDKYLTVRAAKLSQVQPHEHIISSHIELEPMFEKDAAQFKWFTPKELLIFLADIFILTFIRFILPPMFEFLIGSFIFTFLHATLRNIQANVYFHDIKRRPNSIIGRSELSYWISQRGIAMTFLGQAIILTVVALAVPRLFFWGGAFSFFLTSIRHFQLANRKFPQSPNVAST